jgi:hypothetical protein
VLQRLRDAVVLKKRRGYFQSASVDVVEKVAWPVSFFWENYDDVFCAEVMRKKTA